MEKEFSLIVKLIKKIKTLQELKNIAEDVFHFEKSYGFNKLTNNLYDELLNQRELIIK